MNIKKIMRIRIVWVIGLMMLFTCGYFIGNSVFGVTSKSINAMVGPRIDVTAEPPNPNRSFTTRAGENQIPCTGDIKPDNLDGQYNSQIQWDIEDDPNQTGDSGNPPDPQTGPNVTLTVTAPAAPAGRTFKLNYRISANVVINGFTVRSTPVAIIQDEIDQCRQEYIDMSKNHIPTRNEFVNAGSYVNPGHFSFGEINFGDYTYAIFTIAQHCENIRTAMNTGLTVNSGYRSPRHNAAIGGAANSRHIYGDAVDIGVRDFNGDGVRNQADWTLLSNAANNEGATYIEPYSMTGTWVHADWGH